MDNLRPRIGTDVCARCRQEFSPGDRVTTAMIVLKVGRNPQALMETGAFLSDEFELAHIDCYDPQLVKGRDGDR